MELKEQYCLDNTECITPNEKYQCKICQKGFCGNEFVIKHIKNKHEDKMQEDVCEHYFKQERRDAYIKDKDRIENTPSPQQQVVTKKRDFIQKPITDD